jgi:DNA-binding transcriptional MerR regulator
MEKALQNSAYDEMSEETGMSLKAAKKAPGAFLTISEVAEELDVQQHVLRFWETKFSQLKPLKRGGGRRYYRPEDVALLKVIHSLLYTDKYTIKGAQKLLKGQSKMQVLQDFSANNNMPKVASNDQTMTQSIPGAAQSLGLSHNQKQLIREAIADLKELRDIISKK